MCMCVCVYIVLCHFIKYEASWSYYYNQDEELFYPILKPFSHLHSLLMKPYTLEITNLFSIPIITVFQKCYLNWFTTDWTMDWTMSWSSEQCTEGSNQNHFKGKEMQESKVFAWGGLTNTWRKKQCERQGKKGKIHLTECRVPENSKKR